MSTSKRLNGHPHAHTHNWIEPDTHWPTMCTSLVLACSVSLSLSFSSRSIRCIGKSCLTSACTNRKLIEFQQITIRVFSCCLRARLQIFGNIQMQMQMTAWEETNYYIGNSVSLSLLQNIFYDRHFWFSRLVVRLKCFLQFLIGECVCACALLHKIFAIRANESSFLWMEWECMDPSCEYMFLSLARSRLLCFLLLLYPFNFHNNLHTAILLSLHATDASAIHRLTLNLIALILQTRIHSEPSRKQINANWFKAFLRANVKTHSNVIKFSHSLSLAPAIVATLLFGSLRHCYCSNWTQITGSYSHLLYSSFFALFLPIYR